MKTKIEKIKRYIIESRIFLPHRHPLGLIKKVTRVNGERKHFPCTADPAARAAESPVPPAML